MSLVDTLKTWEVDKLKEGELGLFGKAIKLFMGAWPNQATESNVLRASGMFFLCPREFVINYWNPTPNRDFDGVSIFRMAMGSWFHSYFQNCVLGPMCILRGTWKNVENGSLWGGYHPNPVEAVDRLMSGQPVQWEYVEYALYDPQHRIKGHSDGVVSSDRVKWLLDNADLMKTDFVKACNEVREVAEGKLPVLEMKTMGVYMFEQVIKTAKIPEYYQMQVSIYMGLLEKEQSIILFVNRDSWKMQDILYPYSKSWHDEAKRKARIIWTAIRNRKLPESMMCCKTPYDKRAKQCTHKKICWQTRLNVDKWVDEKEQFGKDAGRKFLEEGSEIPERNLPTYE